MPHYEVIPGIGASAAPAWVLNDKKTLMAWKGQGTDTQLYWSTTSTPTPDASGKYSWAPQQKVNFASSTNPALAVLKGVPYMACKGAGNDAGIYLLSQKADGSWAIPAKPLLNFETDDAPALAVTGGALYLAWKGKSDTPIFWSILEEGKDWTAQALVPNNAKTSAAPFLASDGKGAMYLVFKGESDALSWWTKCPDAKTWTTPQKGPGGLLGGPTLAVDGSANKWLAWSGNVNSAAIMTVPQFVFPYVYFCQLVDESANKWGTPTFRTDCLTGFTPALLSTGANSSGLMVAGATYQLNNIDGVFYAPLLLPDQTISFGLQALIVKMMRSGSATFKDETDTVYASIAVQVKGQPTITKTISAGNLTGGQYNQNLIAGPIKIADTDTVYLSYSAINSSAGPSQAVQILTSVSTKIIDALEKADEIAISALEETPITNLPPQEAGALIGAQIGFYVLPGFGAVLGALVGFFSETILGFAFPDCDGPVAQGVYIFTAPQIRNTLDIGNGAYSQTDDNPGVTSAGGCGDNSDYEVVWSVQKA